MELERGIKDFLSFLRRPLFDYKKDKPEAFNILLIIYAFVFMSVFVLALPLMTIIGIDDMEHSMVEAFERLPKWVFFLVAVIAAPIVEELLFRLHLRYPKLGLSILVLVLFGLVAYYLILNQASNLTYGLLGFVGMFCFIFSVTNKTIIEKAHLFYRSNFGVVFYCTLFLFAIAHIANYGNVENWLTAPILVLPQALLALFLGYVRVRNSIWESIFFHALHNFIPTSLFLLMPMQ